MMHGMLLRYGATDCGVVLPALVCVVGISAGLGAESAARPPAAGQDESLSLEQCIEIALRSNPELQSFEWEERAAGERVRQARGERLPSVSAAAGWTHWSRRQALVPPDAPMAPGVYGQNLLNADLVARMPLFTGGRITHGLEAARFSHEAARHRTVRGRRALVFNVSAVFYDILGQRKVIESLDASIKAIREHCKRVQDLLEVQKAARVDLLRTEVRLASLVQARVAERNRLSILHRRLENLLGESPTKAHVEVRGVLQPPATEVPGEEASFRRALLQRADYLAALAEVAALRERVAAAKAERLPTVSLVGTYGRRWGADPDIEQPGSEDAVNMGYAGLTLSVPLFEGGRITSRIREQRDLLTAARRRLRQLELDIRLDVQTAVLTIRSNLERVRATEKAVEQAEESLRIERRKYEVGKGSITDVLDAQSALLDAQTNYYRALAGYHTARAAWRLAVGADVQR